MMLEQLNIQKNHKMNFNLSHISYKNHLKTDHKLKFKIKKLLEKRENL